MLYINGIPIERYGAVLEYGYKTSGVEVETAYSQTGNIICLNQKFGRKKLDMDIFFRGKDHEETYQRYSMFCELLRGKLELIMPDCKMYEAVLTGIGQESTLAPGRIRCSFSFLAVRHGPKQTATGNRIFCESTLPKTDCILTVTVGKTGQNYTLGSVTFLTVTAGEKICVDGITKRILVNGVPAAQRAEWLEFPYLRPGINNIACPDIVTVEFYPAYF